MYDKERLVFFLYDFKEQIKGTAAYLEKMPTSRNFHAFLIKHNVCIETKYFFWLDLSGSGLGP